MPIQLPLPEHIDEKEIQEAVEALKKGSVIAYPTEAVYGLGCDPFNEEAVNHLLAIKNRPAHKGFILVASSWEQVEPLVMPIGPMLLTGVLATWPGPVTWIFPARGTVPHWLLHNNTLAVRVSAHPIVSALCDCYGGPIVSTSANVSGESPAGDAASVKLIFKERVALILNGQLGGQANPTQIRDALSGEVVRE